LHSAGTVETGNDNLNGELFRPDYERKPRVAHGLEFPRAKASFAKPAFYFLKRIGASSGIVEKRFYWLTD
jgi:hypothetical protein